MLFIYLIVILVSTLWLARMIIYKKIIFKNTILTIPLLLFLITQIVATVFSIDKHTSIFGYYGRFNGGLISTISYLLLYFAFVSNIDFSDVYKKVLYFAKVSLLASVAVILWGLPSKFGYDLTCLVFTGSADVSCWSDAFKPTIRMFSTLGQPNWFGAYLSINLFFALHMYFAKEVKKIQILYGYLLLNVLSLLFTRSRSAYLGIAIGLLIFGIFYFFKKLKGKSKKQIVTNLRKRILPLVVIAILAIGINMTIPAASDESGSGETTSNEVITDSFEIRKLVWQGGYNVGMKNFWTGTGVETFAYSYNFLRPADHNFTSEWDFVYNKAHNELINYFTTTGIFGVFAYMLIFAIVISRIRIVVTKLEGPEQILGVLLISTYTAILVSNFFGFSTTTINVYWYLIPAFLLLLIKGDQTQIDEDESPKLLNIQKALLAIPALIFLYGIGYLSLYFAADVHYARGENYRLTQEYDQALFYLYYADSLKEEHIYKDKISQVLAQKGFFESLTLAQNDPLCPTPTGDTDSCFEMARTYIDDAIAVSESNVYYYRTKARNNFLIYQATGSETDFDAAISSISTAQELAPTDPRYPYMKSLFFLGRYDNIQNPTDVDKENLKFRGPGPATTAIKLKPDFKDAYITRGIIYEELGETEAAIADFQYIVDNIDPNDEQAQQELERLKAQ